PGLRHEVEDDRLPILITDVHPRRPQLGQFLSGSADGDETPDSAQDRGQLLLDRLPREGAPREGQFLQNPDILSPTIVAERAQVQDRRPRISPECIFGRDGYLPPGQDEADESVREAAQDSLKRGEYGEFFIKDRQG